MFHSQKPHTATWSPKQLLKLGNKSGNLLIYDIVTILWVTIDGVWTGNWFYWTLTDRNYNTIVNSHTLQFTTACSDSSACCVFTSCLVTASNTAGLSTSMFTASCLHCLSPMPRSSWAELTGFQLPNSWLELNSTPLTELNLVGRVIQPRSRPNRKRHSSVDVGGMVSRVPLQQQCLPSGGPRDNTASHCSPTVVRHHRRCRCDVFLYCMCSHCYANKLFTVP
jgi:hypothetical protein